MFRLQKMENIQVFETFTVSKKILNNTKSRKDKKGKTEKRKGKMKKER
jgi:hypothetical protein